MFPVDAGIEGRERRCVCVCARAHMCACYVCEYVCTIVFMYVHDG